MKRAIKTSIYSLLIALTALTACDKTDYIPEQPSTPPVPGQPTKPAPQPAGDSAVLSLKMAIKVGEVLYDSIPFTADVTTFKGTEQVNSQNFSLRAGTNRVVLHGTHDRYTVRVSKWGITDEITVTKEELKTKGTIVLGGSKAAKRLQEEDNYVYTSEGLIPQGKTYYKYDGDGRLIRVIFYQKYPQHADLQLTFVDKFVYEGGKLDRIDRYDAAKDTVSVPASFTAFNYDWNGRIAEMYNNQTTETAARVSYGIENGYATTTISQFYGNNTSLYYHMKYQGGNKVADEARSSLGHGEGGTYSYDFNINPYIHMSWPNMYLSHESKNNMVAQRKSYSGVVPTGEPYKSDFEYDADGYPKVKITTYKSFSTGADMYRTRTVYHY